MPDYVYALHDFLPEHEDEVSFRAGERIEVVEKDDLYGDGWWQVSSISHFSSTEKRSPPTTFRSGETIRGGRRSFKNPLIFPQMPSSYLSRYAVLILILPGP